MRHEVARLLELHLPFDPVETEHLRAMRQLVDRRGDPFVRTRFSPGHFTASAFVLSPERDRLLMVHHRKLRRWLQPGGHIEDFDRSVEAAARREVLEETGLAALRLEHDGLLDVDVHPIPAHGEEPAHLHHDLRLLFVAEESGVAAGAGVESVRFVPFPELDAVTSEASLQRAVAKIRARVRMERRAQG